MKEEHDLFSFLPKFSRNYSQAERRLFDNYIKYIGRGNPIVWGAMRDWEYAMVLAAIGIDPGKKYLSIGGYNCGLSFILSRHVPLHIVDLVPLKELQNWCVGEGNKWGETATFEAANAKDITGQYDRIFSVSSVEHNLGNSDKELMENVGRLLAPGGICAITVEWSMQPMDKCEKVEGRIYDTKALEERLVKPSGLEWDGFTEMPVNFYDLLKEQYLGKFAPVPFCPALVVLRRSA